MNGLFLGIQRVGKPATTYTNLFKLNENLHVFRITERIRENKRIQLQLRAERRALYAKRRRKSKFKVHESKFYKSYLQQDKIAGLLDQKTREAKTFRRKFRVPYIIFMEIVDEISNSNGTEAIDGELIFLKNKLSATEFVGRRNVRFSRSADAFPSRRKKKPAS